MSKTTPRCDARASSISRKLVPYTLPCTSAHSANWSLPAISRNVALSTKWYSRPSTSLCRGRRVVWETEKRSSGWLSVKMRDFSVVFPAPEGDDRMSRRKSSIPTRARYAPLGGADRLSLDILHLLPHSLDFCLEFNDRVGDREVLRFGSNRIYLARHLLQKEIEAPPYGLFVADVGAELIEMAPQPYELLRGVRALDEQHQFLFDSCRLDGR